MDTIDPLRFIFSFLFVVGLIGLLGFGLKRYTGRRFTPGATGEGRIRIVEQRYLDPKRRLVLVQRDNVEHLLLLAEGRELVIESIAATAMMAAPSSGDKS